MRDLVVVLNEASYIGRFSKPLLQAWGAGEALLRAIYEAFSPYGVSLANVRVENGLRSLGEQAIVVQFGNWATYRWRLERVEFTLANFSEEQLGLAAQILAAGDRWVQHIAGGPPYASHQISYLGHARIEGATSRELLMGLPRFTLRDVGDDLGSGTIFHWYDPQKGWNGTLMLDHSQVLPDGLFTMLSIVVSSGSLDYPRVMIECRSCLDGLLAQMGLKFKTG